MSLRLRLPTCSCLPTLGAGAVVFISIFRPPGSSAVDGVVVTMPPPAPFLSQTRSVMLLLGWLLCLLVASDRSGGTRTPLRRRWWWHKVWTAAHRQRLWVRRQRQLHRSVMHELTDTGHLSHVMRHADTRIVPWVLLTAAAHGDER